MTQEILFQKNRTWEAVLTSPLGKIAGGAFPPVLHICCKAAATSKPEKTIDNGIAPYLSIFCSSSFVRRVIQVEKIHADRLTLCGRNEFCVYK